MHMDELKSIDNSWSETKRTAQNKVRWRTTVAVHLLLEEQRGLTEVIVFLPGGGGGNLKLQFIQ